MNKIIVLITCLILLSQQAVSQTVKNDSVWNKDPFIVKIIDTTNGDTLVEHELPMVVVMPEKVFKNNRERVKYNKLMRNVKIVYPLAKTSGILLEQYAPILDTLHTKKEQDKYFDIIEDELWAKYGKNLKSLTLSQGVILIKLIDRECQRSTYQVIKDFRGGFSAFIYQTLARIWGYNLKIEYDAEDRDKDIEEIVVMIENGFI